ncbi:CocE/NonD family hydrolase [Sinomicrobium sp. M5D2P17]
MNLKTYIALSVATLAITCTFAQQFYFEKKVVNDSSALREFIPPLAEKVLQHTEKDTTLLYYDNLYQMQMAAGHFDDVQQNINKYLDAYAIDRMYEPNIFVYEVYTVAKQIQNTQHMPFDKAFIQAFDRCYDKFPKHLTPSISRNIDEDIPVLKEKLQKQLETLKDKDSISTAQAKALCKAYNNYAVFSETDPLARKLLKKKDEATFIIEEDVLIKTGENATLTATIIRKKTNTTPLPVILVYNIYAGDYDFETAKRAAINGYVGVTVNTRGKRKSPDKIAPFEHDGRDAYDVIDWISKQSWCNGKIGMMGGSYLGFSQWSAVKKLHPALKTIVPQVAVGIGVDYPMQNHVFMSYMLRWIHYVINNKFTDEKSFFDGEHWSELFEKWYKEGSAFHTLDSLNGNPNKIFQRWLDHPGYDKFWQNMVPYREDFANIHIPILTTTGYFDVDQLGAMYYFKEHYKYNPKAQHYLLIGPYSHGGGQSYANKTIGNYTIDKSANISIYKVVYEWFDHVLKNGPLPAALKDKINYQVMGTDEWRHAPSLQNMTTDSLTLYLSNIRQGEHYKLIPRKEDKAEYVRHEIDLSDRKDLEAYNKRSSGILSDDIYTGNGITYISEPLDEDLVINGSFTGEIQAAINKKDMDITMSLYEVLPSGKYFSLSNYIARASYTKDNTKRQLLTPGQKESILITNTFFTSRKLRKGSRLLLVLGINKNPDWQVNYGTGRDVSEETIKDAGEPLDIKWYNDSYIQIGIGNP